MSEERSREERSSICSTGSRGYKIKRWLGIRWGGRLGPDDDCLLSRRSTWLLSLYIIAYFVYLLGGCMMFACLETDLEENIKEFITWAIFSLSDTQVFFCSAFYILISPRHVWRTRETFIWERVSSSSSTPLSSTRSWSVSWTTFCTGGSVPGGETSPGIGDSHAHFWPRNALF